MVDESEVCRLALALPSASQDGTGFGVNGKGFAWIYQQKVAGQRGRTERRDVLAVRVPSLDEKEALLAADPDKFFTDAHYQGFPATLVQLGRGRGRRTGRASERCLAHSRVAYPAEAI